MVFANRECEVHTANQQLTRHIQTVKLFHVKSLTLLLRSDALVSLIKTEIGKSIEQSFCCCSSSSS